LCRQLVVIFVLAWLPQIAAALGEYDGLWVGSESVTIDGQTNTEPSGTIVYQSASNILQFWNEYGEAAIDLHRSGDAWVLPNPQNAFLLGFLVRLETVSLQFPSLDRAIAQYTATAQGVTIAGSADYRRKSCTTIVPPFSTGPFAGAEDSITCHVVNVPTGTRVLRARLRGGRGDADLILLYHKPGFPFAVSEDVGNNEDATVTSPTPGRWFVGVAGFEAFDGVTLSVTLDLSPAPSPSFAAKPSAGAVPLTVQFSDSSSGSIEQWFWDFGDGGTSMERNPRHTFTEPGQYDVTLRITGPGGESSLTQVAAIQANPASTLMPILDLILDDGAMVP
jgi:hypothetical protein